MLRLHAAVFGFSLLFGFSCVDSPCIPGNEGCACTLGACLPGLNCVDDVCVPVGGPASTSGTDSDTTGDAPTSGATTGVATTGEATTGTTGAGQPQ